MSNWRLAKSLAVLRDQVNASSPGRSKSEDGTIGDERHAASKSDHNPNEAGVVCAIDFTHDPNGGFDSYRFAEILRQNRDPRIQYVISNGRIWNTDVQPYVWRQYDGTNKHDKHVHISVKQNPLLYDNESAWNIFSTTMPSGMSGRGSWFSQYRGKYDWVDLGDKPNSNALGVPDDQQGIAFYNHSTLGKWFNVTAPNGVTLRLQQTDIGPHPRTGRLIDIAAVAAERFGYSPDNFPTDGIFTWTEATLPDPAPYVPLPKAPQLQPAPVSQPDLTNILNGLVKVLEVIGPIVVEQAKKPEVRAGAMSAISALIPTIGTAVPWLGVLGLVATQLLANAGVMGAAIGPGATPTGNSVATVSAGLLGGWLLNLLKRGVDKMKGPTDETNRVS